MDSWHQVHIIQQIGCPFLIHQKQSKGQIMEREITLSESELIAKIAAAYRRGAHWIKINPGSDEYLDKA